MAYYGYDMYGMLNMIMMPLMMVFQLVLMIQMFQIILGMIPQLLKGVTASLGGITGTPSG